MSRSKDLVKNTMIITIGRISTQFVSFLLLPLYTALLSTEEYGTVDLITTIVQLCVPIVSMMIDQATFRYLLNAKSYKEEKVVISSSFWLLTGFNLCFAGIYCVVCSFADIPYKGMIILIMIATTYSNLYLQIARGLRNTFYYSLGSFVCSAVTIILNVVCIVGLHMGVYGMLLATLIGNLCCSIFILIKLRIYRYISFVNINKQTLRGELKYSIPLVPNQLSIWIMNSSDRVIVSLFLGTAANGILAASHKFATIYLTLFNIFQLAWHETGALHFYDEDRDEFFSEMLEKILVIFSIICIAMIIVLPIVFGWFIDLSFDDAYYYIPIYLTASLFNVVIGTLGVVYVATKKTFEIAKTTILSAIINVIVHVLLISYVGLYAASISTLIGYLITMKYRIIDTKKYLNIKYNKKKFTIIFILLICSIFIYYIRNIKISLISIPIFVILLCVVNVDILKEILKVVKNKSRNKKNE